MKNNTKLNPPLINLLFVDSFNSNSPIFQSQMEVISLINKKLPGLNFKQSYFSRMLNGRRSIPLKINDTIIDLIKSKIQDEVVFEKVKGLFVKMVGDINASTSTKKLLVKDMGVGIISLEELQQLIPVVTALGGIINYADIPSLILIIRTNKH